MVLAKKWLISFVIVFSLLVLVGFIFETKYVASATECGDGIDNDGDGRIDTGNVCKRYGFIF